jgi:hypothetical protein
MRHQDLQVNHILESWVYADAAHRNSATGFVAGDIGRISFQTDTGQYFRLTATTPSWELIGPQTPQAMAYAFQQIAQVSPSPTSNASGVFMGLGVGHVFTPTATGKVLVSFDGTIENTVSGKTAFAWIQHGSGTPPANGTVATVVQDSGIASELDNWGTGETQGACAFCCKALYTGLTVGQGYWFDLVAKTVTGGTTQLFFVGGTMVELP